MRTARRCYPTGRRTGDMGCSFPGSASARRRLLRSWPLTRDKTSSPGQWEPVGNSHGLWVAARRLPSGPVTGFPWSGGTGCARGSASPLRGRDIHWPDFPRCTCGPLRGGSPFPRRSPAPIRCTHPSQPRAKPQLTVTNNPPTAQLPTSANRGGWNWAFRSSISRARARSCS